MNRSTVILRSAVVVLLPLTAFTLAYLTGGGSPAGTPASSTDIRSVKKTLNTAEPEPAIATDEARRKQLFSAFYQIRSHASRAHRTAAFAELVRSLSLNELLLVADALADLPSDIRESAIQALLARLLEISPETAVKLVQESKNIYPSYLFDLWARSDPKSAVAWWKTLRLSGPSPSSTRIGFMLIHLADTDPALAADILLSEGSLLEDLAFKEVFEKFAKSNPEAAMDAATKVSNITRRRVAMSASVRGWTAKDPAKALAWFRQITDPRLRADAATGVAVGIFASAPDQSLEIAHSLPEGRDRDTTFAVLADTLLFKAERDDFLRVVAEVPFDPSNAAVAQLIRNWSFNDAEGFVHHIIDRLNLPSLDAEERRAIESFIEKDPLLAFSFNASTAAEALTAGKGVSEATRQGWIERAATGWGRRNFAAARDWAEKLPAGPVRDAAFAGLASGRSVEHFEDAAHWLETLPASSTRNAAVGGFVRTVLARDPSAALEWLHTLPDAAQRLKVLQDGWKQWRKQDPVQAEKWRDSATGLTTAERGALSPGDN